MNIAEMLQTVIQKSYVSPDINEQITNMTASGKLSAQSAGILVDNIANKDSMALVVTVPVDGMIGRVNILDLNAKATQIPDGNEPNWSSDSYVGKLTNLGYELPLQSVKLFATVTNEEIKAIGREYDGKTSVADLLLQLFAKKLANEIWRVALTSLAPGYPDTDPDTGVKPFNSMHGYIDILLNAGRPGYIIPQKSGIPNRVKYTGNIVNDINSLIDGHDDDWLDEFGFENTLFMSARTRQILHNQLKSSAQGSTLQDFAVKPIEYYNGYPIKTMKYLKKYASGNQAPIIFGYPKAMFVFINTDNIQRGSEYRPNAYAWYFSFNIQMTMGLLPSLFSVIVADTDSDDDLTDEGILTSGGPTISNIASNDTGQVDLDWTPVNDAVKYTLQYSTDSDFGTATVINNLTDTAAEITGLTSGTKYYFRVQGVASNGATSAWSNVESVVVQ